MRTNPFAAISICALIVTIIACSDAPPGPEGGSDPICTPQEKKECVCDDGIPGTQICNDTGDGFVGGCKCDNGAIENENCPDLNTPHFWQEQCVECVNDSHCDTGKFCNANTYMCMDGDNNPDCSGFYFDEKEGLKIEFAISPAI